MFEREHLLLLRIFSRLIAPGSLSNHSLAFFAIASSLSLRLLPCSLQHRSPTSLCDCSLALSAIAPTFSSQSLAGSLRHRSLTLFAIAPTVSSQCLPHSLRNRSLALFAIAALLPTRTLVRSLLLFVLSSRHLSLPSRSHSFSLSQSQS